LTPTSVPQLVPVEVHGPAEALLMAITGLAAASLRRSLRQAAGRHDSHRHPFRKIKNISQNGCAVPLQPQSRPWICRPPQPGDCCAAPSDFPRLTVALDLWRLSASPVLLGVLGGL
jgi:hypothetical protein